MAEKIIRDPVHDVIAFRLDKPGDALLWELLQTPEFQRLRRIRQLGLANLAYPGADHTRYGHSLGVMEMCRRMLEQLQRSVALDEHDCIATLAAALLHDLGHGPFSHVFERVSGTHHESLTVRLITEPGSEVNRLLTNFDAGMPARVRVLLEGDDTPTGGVVPGYMRACISSQLDADRLDYLLRDDLMTGSRYGQYDLQWLLRSLTVEPATRRLAVSYKGVSAVEGYLQARHHMYRNVYFHKVVRSGEGMLRLALQRAKRLAVQQRLPGAMPIAPAPVAVSLTAIDGGGGGSGGADARSDHHAQMVSAALRGAGDEALIKALMGQALTSDEFIGLDDVTVLHSFKLWQASDDTVLARLCHGLLFRKLYKTVELPVQMEPEEAAVRLKRAVEAVLHAGGDAGYDLFYDEPSHTPYEALSPEDPAGMAEIQLLDAAGSLRPFTAVSAFGASLRQFAFRRIHVREEYKAVVLDAVK